METVLEAYIRLNDRAEDNNTEYVSYETFVGRMVQVRSYVDGQEVWSEKAYKIISFDDNACGDGCCQSFQVNGFENLRFWSSDLRLVSA